MSRILKRRYLLLLPLVVLFSACATASSPLLPAGPAAKPISDLFWIIVGIAAFFFVVVYAGMWGALLKFRARPGDGEPRQVYSNIPLEIIWTVVPTIAIGVAVYFNIATTVQERPDLAGHDPSEAPAVRVQVYAHQWWWEFRYPDLGITTATELYVPVGRRVDFTMYSDNVIHSFGAPELTPGKTDVIPGQANATWLRADKVGTYNGYCYEFCGEEHAMMRFWIVAVPPQGFVTWVKDQQAKPKVSEQDWLAFSERWCPACHAIDGTEAKGLIGPSLSHVASRQHLAGGAFENTPEGLKRWLKDPQAIKHGNAMPSLDLTDAMIDRLVSFLATLK